MAQHLADQTRDDHGRQLTPMVLVAIGAALFGALGFSFAGMPWIAIGPAALALLVTGLAWLAVFVLGPTTVVRPRPRGWIATGVVLAVAIGGIALNLPVKARFALSAPAFNQLVKQAGPPPAELGDNDLIEMPVDCPEWVGLYAIDSCENTSGGYLFFDPLGNAMVDYAGFAYLPNGPRLESNAGFELQELVHLQGDWYAFAASW